MGTSRRWDGPKNGKWSSAKSALTRSANALAEAVDDIANSSAPAADNAVQDVTAEANYPVTISVEMSEHEVEKHADRYLEALHAALADEPNVFNLSQTAQTSAVRLIDTLVAISEDGPSSLGLLAGETPDEREVLFIGRFAARVAGNSGRTADAVTRKTAVRCAEMLLEKEPAIKRAVREGSDGETSIPDEIFCLLYELFFAEEISVFLNAAIAGHLVTAFPILPAADPTGLITNKISEKLGDAVPTPCEEKRKYRSASPIADIGRDLASDTVKRALETVVGG